MRLKTGCTPAFCLAFATWASPMPHSFCHARVREPHGFQPLQSGPVPWQAVPGKSALGVDDGGHALKKPFVPMRYRRDLVDAHPGAQGLGDAKDAEGARTRGASP